MKVLLFQAVMLIALVGIPLTGACRAGEFQSYFGETYVLRDSGPLKADLYIPSGEGPYPGVLVVHGGAWHMGTRAQLSGFAQMLAQHGVSAVAISYRFAPKHPFPAQIEDCSDAVRWMVRNAKRLKIDPHRIGGFGYSAGAQLVALLGTAGVRHPTGQEDANDAPDDLRLRAVAGGGVPCDFRLLPLDHPILSFWLGGTRRERAETYRLASPAAFISPDDPPMFFFHGENDRLVPIESPTAMCRGLQDAGVKASLYVVPNADHVFAVMNRTALEKSVSFLVHQLQPASATP